MTKIPPDEFIQTNIGTIGANNSWNNIPTSQIKEYIPENKSLEELNRIKQNLREYYKRVNGIIINVSGSGAAGATLYTIPGNQILYIDTIRMMATGTGAGTSNFTLNASSWGSTNIGQLRCSVAMPHHSDITFNNPIVLYENSTLSYAVGANIGAWTIVVTGWLEDKSLTSLT